MYQGGKTMASTPTRDLQEEFLAATRKSQDTVVRALKTWVQTVRTVTQKMPSAYAPLGHRLPTLPYVTMPFADRLPKPEEVVASSYDLAEHLLAMQRNFAEELLEATLPLMPVNGKSPQAPAVKAEPKPVVAQSAPEAPAIVTERTAVVARAVPKLVAVPSTPQAPAVRAVPKVPATVAPKAPAAKSAAKPSAAKPRVAKPSAAKPSAAKPSAAKPSAAKPSAAKPAASKPARKPAARRAPKGPDAS
jgi:hypothetical protein